jgi:plastocyanin
VTVDEAPVRAAEAPPRRARRVVPLLVVLLLLAGVVFGAVQLLGNDAGRGPEASPRRDLSDLSAAEAALVTLRLGDRRFNPDEIRVKEGSAVSLRLENKDEEKHNFYLKAPENSPFVNIDIAAEKTVGFSFRAPKKAGEYEFHCRFHRDEGMTGTVVVTG